LIRKRRDLMFLALLAAAVAGVREPRAVSAQEGGFDAIMKEYSKENQDLMAKYRAEKDPQAQAKIRQEILGLSPKYATRFLEFARANPKDPQAATALGRVLSAARGGPQFDEAIELLVANHIESPEIATVCQILANNRDPKAEAALVTISEKSTNPAVKGQALMSIAGRLNDAAGREGSIEMAQKAIAMLERVVNEFADVAGARGKLGDLAKADLENVKKFGVGQTAPEIEGEDIDGVAFKLSDYRGKVVMLDFWGHW